MALVELLFDLPPVGPGNELVFGDTGPEPIEGDAHLSGAVVLRRPSMAGGVRVGVRVGGAAVLRRPWLAGGLRYVSGASRPVVSSLNGRLQDAGNLRTGVAGAMQDGQRVAASATGRWQDATPLRASTRGLWADTIHLGRQVGARQQDARPVGASTHGAHADTLGLHHGRTARLQDALLQAGSAQDRSRDTVAVLASFGSRLQDTLPFVHSVWSRSRTARLAGGQWGSRYQDARMPPPGFSVPPGPEPEPPCYVPNTDLLFVEQWVAGTDLLFVCERGGSGPQPGATVVVPIRRVYMTTNSLTLHRYDTGQPIAADGFALSIDADSWTWSWSANVREQGLQLLLGGAGDDPREVLATINGIDYVLCAESFSRERSFGKTGVRVQGRGRAAALDAPYAPVLNHAAAEDRTAQQLMNQALMLNGVGIGWDVAWGVTDWFVPGGTWAHQGSYISAVLDIASAAGAIVQPHRTAKTLRVLPRYPAMPRDWAALTPDFELPADVVAVEGIEWVTRPAYDRVHVVGTTADGVSGEWTRAGQAGEIVAPMVTHPLITHADASRQRALPELANTGRQALVSLRMPVLDDTGLILPGSLVRYVDTTVTGSPSRLGLVRSSALSWTRPTLRQTLQLETHGG